MAKKNNTPSKAPKNVVQATNEANTNVNVADIKAHQKEAKQPANIEKLTVKSPYFDTELKRDVKVGDVIKVSPERAAIIRAAGFVE